ncbi:hypothetical protein CMUST_01100 [Corynebacterium mustelae]|uniref:Uncharacterized protein n=1 Tax=Corynebacterium mustelae TaxID=571915 RepID=A0A0G3GVK3_9CORY|nr:hypothetical protein [Corynebacterium mustelae]AKK04570.1 hypothetical protein CMUST_01100 [Corynebacterium mustelae]
MNESTVGVSLDDVRAASWAGPVQILRYGSDDDERVMLRVADGSKSPMQISLDLDQAAELARKVQMLSRPRYKEVRAYGGKLLRRVERKPGEDDGDEC